MRLNSMCVLVTLRIELKSYNSFTEYMLAIHDGLVSLTAGFYEKKKKKE